MAKTTYSPFYRLTLADVSQPVCQTNGDPPGGRDPPFEKCCSNRSSSVRLFSSINQRNDPVLEKVNYKIIVPFVKTVNIFYSLVEIYVFFNYILS